MKATLAFLCAVTLVCLASIMLRNSVIVFFSAIGVSFIWALIASRMANLKAAKKLSGGIFLSLGVIMLMLLGTLNLPLVVTFHMYRHEFIARVMDGLIDRRKPRARGSTGPFKIIREGSRDHTTYFLTQPGVVTVNGFVFAPDQPNGEGERLRGYGGNTKVSLGEGWWYVEEG